MKTKIRKIVTFVEETRTEMGQPVNPPTRRAAAAAVVENPFAGKYVEDLTELMEIGEELGALLTERAVAALGIPGASALDSDFTGVESDMAPAKTLETALRLQPGTEHVVVVNGGISNHDRHMLASVKEELKAFADHQDITYMTGLSMSDLLERLGHLQPHTVVLLTSIGQDATGTRFTSREFGPLVAAAANAPVFSLFDVHLNHGEVGAIFRALASKGRLLEPWR